MSIIQDSYRQSLTNQQQLTQPFVTIGIVADTNDPQQMGRVRAACPSLGDSYDTPVVNLPWCINGTARFAGQLQVGPRGSGSASTEGMIAYGNWSVPKVGAQVLVMCIDGNPEYRVFIGSIHWQLAPHTLPHGRWKYEDNPALQKTTDQRPFGPYSGSEKFIQPLQQNLQMAFGNKGEPNYEWRTRAADYQASAVDIEDLPYVYSKVQDDKDYMWDDWKSRQGYELNRQDPEGTSPITGKLYDNMVYSTTTPGFHSISMDDRQQNCRIRFRTTAGHQIIMDDTNERIYISTYNGYNWIELDAQGNIDIHTERRLSIHASKDINLTSDETIRMQAKKGIHFVTDDEIRMEAKKDVSFRFAKNWRVNVGEVMYLQSNKDSNIKAGARMNIQSKRDLSLSSAAAIKVTSSGVMSFGAGGVMTFNAPKIQENGPAGPTATAAKSPDEQPAKWTNRVPQHEPWGRVMTKDDFTHAPEFDYTSKEINKVERGETLNRGTFWRR